MVADGRAAGDGRLTLHVETPLNAYGKAWEGVR
jgi:hypothetical protein